MSDWLIDVGGTRIGPLSDDAMLERRRSGEVPADALVWRPGMTDWARADAAVPADGPIPPLAPAAGNDGPVRPDPGPFHTLGRHFKTPNGDWQGAVVASRAAVYLLKEAVYDSGDGFGVKNLIKAAAGTTHDPTATCYAADLPQPARAAVDPSDRFGDREVVVLTRAAVSRLSVPSFDNGVVVRTARARFMVYITPLGNRGIRHFLTANGWLLGVDLKPTEDAVLTIGAGQADRAGRSDVPPPVARTGDSPYVGRLESAAHRRPALRVLYVLAALAIVALLVYVKARRQFSR